MKQKKFDHLERLNKLNVDVYMQEKCDEVKRSVKYPLKKVKSEFGDYLTNSISYMLALAILENFEEIHLYGVNMSVNTEYSHQRPSCEYFLGIARGRGIKIHIPKESDLLKSNFLYGYEQEKVRDLKLTIQKRKNTLCLEVKRIDKQIEELQKYSERISGGLEEIKNIELTLD